MFRVWYADGTTYTGPPSDAPKTGVVVIIQREPEGVVSLLGRDYYVWRGARTGDGWFPCDIFGLWSYLTSPGCKVVLFGQTIRTADYRKIVTRAEEASLDG